MLVPGWARADDTTIVSQQVETCRLSIEANERWQTLRVRASHPEHKRCAIPVNSVQELLALAFSKSHPPRPQGPYTSLFLGRLIDFPDWSRALAKQALYDTRWNRNTGRPIQGHINDYAATLLLESESLEPLKQVLADAGYRITGVSMEKVLVDSFNNLNLNDKDSTNAKFPYDAMTWLVLSKGK